MILDHRLDTLAKKGDIMPSINNRLQCIKGFEVGTITNVALEILLRFMDLPDKSYRLGKKGGFLALAVENRATGRSHFPLVVEIGFCPDDLLRKAQKEAQEKCRRLDRTKEKTSHISSYQSRNHQQGKYGGGIVTEEGTTVGFAGLSEPQNEAITVVLCLALGWIGPEYAADIKAISQNVFTDHLINTCVDIIETDWSKK